jgi:hypothetical protein
MSIKGTEVTCGDLVCNFSGGVLEITQVQHKKYTLTDGRKTRNRAFLQGYDGETAVICTDDYKIVDGPDRIDIIKYTNIVVKYKGKILTNTSKGVFEEETRLISKVEPLTKTNNVETRTFEQKESLSFFVIRMVLIGTLLWLVYCALVSLEIPNAIMEKIAMFTQ